MIAISNIQSAQKFVDENAIQRGEWWFIKFNDGVHNYHYIEKSKEEILNRIKKHFGL